MLCNTSCYCIYETAHNKTLGTAIPKGFSFKGIEGVFLIFKIQKNRGLFSAPRLSKE